MLDFFPVVRRANREGDECTGTLRVDARRAVDLRVAGESLARLPRVEARRIVDLEVA